MTKEEAKKFGLHLLQGIMERNESYPVYANNVKQAIDALSEQSGSSEIPNDLEEAAEKYGEEHQVEYYSDAYNIHTSKQDLVDAVIYGAKTQKEEILKEAADAMVTTNLANRPVIYLDQLEGLKYGDKVRVIVIKDNNPKFE